MRRVGGLALRRITTKPSGRTILRSVQTAELEKLLRDLPRLGTLVKDRGYRQVWTFPYQGKSYFLKFYPREGFRDAWRRRFRGSPALREFSRLQWLQRAKVAAPKAVAYLSGLTLDYRKGDAVILHAIEPAVQLDLYLNDLAVRGEPVPNHLKLSEQIRSLVYALGKAGLGHSDLHLGNFLLSDGQVYLLDAYAVRSGGMRLRDVMKLGHSASRFATRTDLLRGWDLVGSGGPMPPNNPQSATAWRGFAEKSKGDGRYFARVEIDGWQGICFQSTKYPRRFSPASQQTFTAEQWTAATRELLAKLNADTLHVIKRTASGDVLAGEMAVGERRLDVIVKRPRKKHLYRYAVDALRGGRARRAWFKSYRLIARNLPAAWPLLLLEKKQGGYVTDAMLIFERVEGQTLAKADLDAMPAPGRQMLFRRIGRLLKRMETLGLYHYDTKASNWIVRPDLKLGPSPVMVDVDGIRKMPSQAFGLRRLLRSMQDHPQYSPDDSLQLCRGYAPYAPLAAERLIPPSEPRGDEPQPSPAVDAAPQR